MWWGRTVGQGLGLGNMRAGHNHRSQRTPRGRPVAYCASGAGPLLRSVRPTTTMSKSVSFTLKSERLARIGEEQFILPAHSVLAGQLSLKTSDGPMGLREFEQPSFLHACFDFEFGGRQMRYAGFIRWSALWAPDGTQTTFEDPGFIPECGMIEGLNDSRADWFYIRSDGRRHTNRLKYTGSTSR